jgi:methionyl-tRNA formyltransferase
MGDKLNIIYMGTPEFAVAPLDILLKNGYIIKAVVTSPDKPAGRGLKLNESAVKKFALSNNLKVLQPTNLKSPEFIDEIKRLNPDIQIVVAFRMLPELIWKIPSSGTLNLHASLLPQYRGAAPINWVIINGETKTGVTTFFINENIDTGNIIMSQEIPVLPDETAGDLHDKLMFTGADLVLQTLKHLESGNYHPISQQSLLKENLTLKIAPKISKEVCKINWNSSADNIFNHIRGLSPSPVAFTELVSPEGKPYYIKVFGATKEISQHNFKSGQIITNGKTILSIAVTDGFIYLQEIQLSGKKKMLIDEFLRGFPMNDSWNTNIIKH